MPKGKVKAEAKEDIVTSIAISTSAAPFVALLKEHLPGQRFTDEEIDAILRVLAVVDGNASRAARLTGLSLGAVWEVKQRNMAAFTELREAWKRSHALKAADLADMMAEKIAQKVEEEDASLRDLAVAWGITVQRGMDLAGEGATVTHKHVHSVDKQALETLAHQLHERLQAARDASGDVIEADFRVVE